MKTETRGTLTGRTCRRCHQPTETVTNVAPNRRDPGFVAWLCPSCNAADSELVYSTNAALAAYRTPRR
jgi:hypothetical protein